MLTLILSWALLSSAFAPAHANGDLVSFQCKCGQTYGEATNSAKEFQKEFFFTAFDTGSAVIDSPCSDRKFSTEVRFDWKTKRAELKAFFPAGPAQREVGHQATASAQDGVYYSLRLDLPYDTGGKSKDPQNLHAVMACRQMGSASSSKKLKIYD
jgi:hypothetical protein